MKVLIVTSGNSGIIAPFIKEQANSLRRHSVTSEYYIIKGKGIFGYLKNYIPLKQKINTYKPDLVHAHYGLSGLLSSLQRKVSVITTFHGSDINLKKNWIFSYFASKLSKECIFVHLDQPTNIKYHRYIHIIPCGINFEIFHPINKYKARKLLSLENNKIYCLFSSHFNKKGKNFTLAKKAVALLTEKVELIELKNKSREEVNLLMNAVDLLLITSFSETGPLVVKEAMACNCPIVSTDVGDVSEIIRDIEGCYLSAFNPHDVAQNIIKGIKFGKRTKGRGKVLFFDNKIIAKKIYAVYKSCV